MFCCVSGPPPQGNNGRRRGVLVLDIWDKAAVKPKVTRTRSAPAASSWRATPYASQPGSSADVSDASSAAARSYYSLMNGSSGNGHSSSIASPTDSIYDPVHSHQPDPSVMQLWTDKPRFSSPQPAYGAETQQHHDPWRQQPQPQQPRILVPPPPSHATSEEFARWQALQSVMAALQHSSGVCVCVRCFPPCSCLHAGLSAVLRCVCSHMPACMLIPLCLWHLHCLHLLAQTPLLLTHFLMFLVHVSYNCAATLQSWTTGWMIPQTPACWQQTGAWQPSLPAWDLTALQPWQQPWSEPTHTRPVMAAAAAVSVGQQVCT